MNKGSVVAPTIDLVKLGLGFDSRNYNLLPSSSKPMTWSSNALYLFILIIFPPLPMRHIIFVIIATLVCGIFTNTGTVVYTEPSFKGQKGQPLPCLLVLLLFAAGRVWEMLQDNMHVVKNHMPHSHWVHMKSPVFILSLAL